MPRPSKLTESKQSAILGAVRAGTTLKSMIKDRTVPSEKTFYNWLHANEPFLQSYIKAKEFSVLHDENRVESIVQDILDNKLEPNRAKVASDLIMRLAKVKAPNRHGDKPVDTAVKLKVVINKMLDVQEVKPLESPVIIDAENG